MHTHTLNVDQLLEAANDSGLPGYEIYRDFLENAAQQLSDALAAHLGVKSGVADFQGMAFAGLCATFSPPDDNPEMKVPWQIAGHDSGSSWAQEIGVEEEPETEEE